MLIKQLSECRRKVSFPPLTLSKRPGFASFESSYNAQMLSRYTSSSQFAFTDIETNMNAKAILANGFA